MENRNPGFWHVTHQYAGGEKYIRVYRLRDVDAADHSGNREYIDEIFATDREASARCRELNEPMAGKVTEYCNYGGLH